MPKNYLVGLGQKLADSRIIIIEIRRRQKHLLRIAELYAFLVVLAILKMKLGAWVDENIFLLQNIELGVGDDKTKTTNFSLTIETVGTFYIKK